MNGCLNRQGRTTVFRARRSGSTRVDLLMAIAGFPKSASAQRRPLFNPQACRSTGTTGPARAGSSRAESANPAQRGGGHFERTMQPLSLRLEWRRSCSGDCGLWSGAVQSCAQVAIFLAPRALPVRHGADVAELSKPVSPTCRMKSGLTEIVPKRITDSENIETDTLTISADAHAGPHIALS